MFVQICMYVVSTYNVYSIGTPLYFGVYFRVNYYRHVENKNELSFNSLLKIHQGILPKLFEFLCIDI